MTDYKVGQGWALDASEDLPPILVFIHSLEEFEHAGLVAGVAVEPHPEAKDLGGPSVSHFPITAEHLGLDAGRLALTDQVPSERFWEGYNTWLEKFQNSKAGVFTVSAQEAYKLVLGVVEDVNDD